MVQNIQHTRLARETTFVVSGGEETTKTILGFLSEGKMIDVVASSEAPSVAMKVEQISIGLVNAVSKGAKIRFLTEVTKENMEIVKELAKIAEVRHLDNIKGGSAISEKAFMSTTLLVKEKPVPQLIYSSAMEIVEQQRYIFETLWNIARPVQQRMSEIEDGREREFMELITDNAQASKTFAELLKSAEKKVSLLLPHKTSFAKSEAAGVIETLADKANIKRAEVRLICPLNEKDRGYLSSISPKLKAAGGHESSMSLLIVDDKKCIVVEESEEDGQSGGFILYTNSPPAVKSFRTLFDIQWRELALVESLLSTGKQRDEFISVAAHELRNPITPIMLFVDGLKEEMGERPEIAGIVRNTRRLQRLIQDILDVAKVDNKNLALKKVDFDMDALLDEACEDAQNQGKGKNVKILFEPAGGLLVNADRARISQVVYNLLDNALKFTQKGTIKVMSKKSGKGVEVSVRDEGTGISPKVVPRLFEKFVTASDSGTGIGLYLSKAIVEAHGGRIWAENDKGTGATFYFFIPAT
jgi:two-component sensor histidine kinase